MIVKKQQQMLPQGFFPSNVPAKHIADHMRSTWLIFWGQSILFFESQIPRFSREEVLKHFGKKASLDALYVGEYRETSCFTVQIKAEVLKFPQGIEAKSVREACMDNKHTYSMIARAKQLTHWSDKHKFCGICGKETILQEKERAKKCTACAELFFPAISPAMITLVYRNDGRVLLGRSIGTPNKRYSILAGFVEPGETVEQCVEREIHEESGIRIKNIRYVGSQQWPFPSSLMLGFIAEYEDGEIVKDSQELEDVQWFSMNNLPELPPENTLSRQMIEAYKFLCSQHLSKL